MPTLYYVLTFAYCVGIFLLSADPAPPQPSIGLPFMDKAAHGLVYAGLCTVVAIGMRRSQRDYSGCTLFWTPILFAALYGLSDEFHQYFVPNRQFEFSDMAANTAGAVVAQLLLWKLYTRAVKKPS